MSNKHPENHAMTDLCKCGETWGEHCSLPPYECSETKCAGFTDATQPLATLTHTCPICGASAAGAYIEPNRETVSAHCPKHGTVVVARLTLRECAESPLPMWCD